MNYLGISQVSKDHKITVIKKANRFLHITGGDVVAFYEDNGTIILKKVDIE
jgi:hypothetical protein